MQSLLFKDKKRRQLFIKYEEKKYILKYIQNNLNISKTIRERAYTKYLQMPNNSSLTRVRNRCVLTNRPRAVYKKFKFSRIQFRNLALEGEIPGVRKATW
jgi:ribosomal protein S14